MPSLQNKRSQLYAQYKDTVFAGLKWSSLPLSKMEDLLLKQNLIKANQSITLKIKADAEKAKAKVEKSVDSGKATIQQLRQYVKNKGIELPKGVDIRTISKVDLKSKIVNPNGPNSAPKRRAPLRIRNVTEAEKAPTQEEIESASTNSSGVQSKINTSEISLSLSKQVEPKASFKDYRKIGRESHVGLISPEADHYFQYDNKSFEAIFNPSKEANYYQKMQDIPPIILFDDLVRKTTAEGIKKWLQLWNTYRPDYNLAVCGASMTPKQIKYVEDFNDTLKYRILYTNATLAIGDKPPTVDSDEQLFYMRAENGTDETANIIIERKSYFSHGKYLTFERAHFHGVQKHISNSVHPHGISALPGLLFLNADKTFDKDIYNLSGKKFYKKYDISKEICIEEFDFLRSLFFEQIRLIQFYTAFELTKLIQEKYKVPSDLNKAGDLLMTKEVNRGAIDVGLNIRNDSTRVRGVVTSIFLNYIRPIYSNYHHFLVADKVNNEIIDTVWDRIKDAPNGSQFRIQYSASCTFNNILVNTSKNRYEKHRLSSYKFITLDKNDKKKTLKKIYDDLFDDNLSTSRAANILTGDPNVTVSSFNITDKDTAEIKKLNSNYRPVNRRFKMKGKEDILHLHLAPLEIARFLKMNYIPIPITGMQYLIVESASSGEARENPDNRMVDKGLGASLPDRLLFVPQVAFQTQIDIVNVTDKTGSCSVENYGEYCQLNPEIAKLLQSKLIINVSGEDNLCLFRCVWKALNEKEKNIKEKEVKDLAEFCTKTKDFKSFAGADQRDIETLSAKEQINIVVVVPVLNDDGKIDLIVEGGTLGIRPSHWRKIYLLKLKFDECNSLANHFLLIKDIKALMAIGRRSFVSIGKILYSCASCQTNLSTEEELIDHEKICCLTADVKKFNYVKKVYAPAKFQNGPDTLRYYKTAKYDNPKMGVKKGDFFNTGFCTYDTEALLLKVDDFLAANSTDNLKYERVHKLIQLGVSSNICLPTNTCSTFKNGKYKSWDVVSLSTYQKKVIKMVPNKLVKDTLTEVVTWEPAKRTLEEAQLAMMKYFIKYLILLRDKNYQDCIAKWEYDIRQEAVEENSEVVKGFKEKLIHPSCDEAALKEIIDEIKNERIKKCPQLMDYFRTIPCLAFNSSKYDLQIMQNALIPAILEFEMKKEEKAAAFDERTRDLKRKAKKLQLELECKEGALAAKDLKADSSKIINVIKAGNKFKSFEFYNIKLLDMMCYLPPGVNYETFVEKNLKGMEEAVYLKKLPLCYDYLDSMEKLLEPKLPTDEKFWFNQLKQSTPSKNEIAEAFKFFEQNECRNILHYLIVYNFYDTYPFVVVLQKVILPLWKKLFNCEPFHDAISTPGLALPIAATLMTEKDPKMVFVTPDKEEYLILRRGLTGGLSTVFNRKQEAYETFIREAKETATKVASNESDFENDVDNLADLESIKEEILEIYTKRNELKIETREKGKNIEYVSSCTQKLMDQVNAITERLAPKFDFAESIEEDCDVIKTWFKFFDAMNNVNYEELEFFEEDEEDENFSSEGDEDDEEDENFSAPSFRGVLNKKEAKLFNKGNHSSFLNRVNVTEKEIKNLLEKILKKISDAMYKKQNEIAKKYGAKVTLSIQGVDANMLYLSTFHYKLPFGESVLVRDTDVLSGGTAAGVFSEKDELLLFLKTCNNASRCRNFKTFKGYLDQKTNEKSKLGDYDYLLEKTSTLPCVLKNSGIELSSIPYGAYTVDLIVPDNLKNYFGEFCPIIKNTNLDARNGKSIYSGRFTEEKAHDRNRSSTESRKALIGSMWGSEYVVVSDLLIWMVQHGVKVTYIHSILHYTQPKDAKFMADLISRGRYDNVKADNGPAAELWKLFGNSIYGSSIQNKEKQTNVVYTSSRKAVKYFRRPTFVSECSINDEIFEIQNKKDEIKMDLPTQLGVFVYSLSKLRMLQFYYDCLDKYCYRSDFECIQSDTDSLYMGLSMPSFWQIFGRKKYCTPEEFREWFPLYENVEPVLRTKEMNDIKTRGNYVPGLFKTEWSGRSLVALSPKCYFGQTFSNKGNKISCKGTSKNQNKGTLTFETFNEILEKGDKLSTNVATNRGFRYHKGRMLTYCQTKKGLSSEYEKRFLLDKIKTTFPQF